MPLTSLLLLCLSSSPQEVERPWTLMVYAAVDNNAEGGFLEFLDSIRVALDDDPGMELVLYLDRSEGFSRDSRTLGADFTGGRVYRVTREQAHRLDASDHLPGLDASGDVEVDSADPRQLGGFVAFCKERFPARRYGLMIYSHANGQVLCPDDGNDSEMSIPQLSDAVGAEAAVDFLALELCQMAGLEIAYQWRPGNGGFSADVLVAIPNAGIPLDWDRAFRRIRSPGHDSEVSRPLFDPADLTAEAFGRLVIEEGYLGRRAMLEEYRRERPVEVQAAIEGRHEDLREAAGCFDLRHAGEAKAAVDRLARALMEASNRAAFEALRGPASDPLILHYAAPGGYARRPYADAYALFEQAAASEDLTPQARLAAAQARDAVDALVLASFGLEEGFGSFQDGRNGVFLVFPDGAGESTGRDGEVATGWARIPWYTPLTPREESGFYGRWSFLADGATPGNGRVESWFELLDAWFDDTADDPAGFNGYAW